MSKELPFMILCIEEYKNQKGMTGKEVIDLFNKYSVCEYIKDFYEVLHTTGTKYIVNDLDIYIKWIFAYDFFSKKKTVVFKLIINSYIFMSDG